MAGEGEVPRNDLRLLISWLKASDIDKCAQFFFLFFEIRTNELCKNAAADRIALKVFFVPFQKNLQQNQTENTRD